MCVCGCVCVCVCACVSYSHTSNELYTACIVCLCPHICPFLSHVSNISNTTLISILSLHKNIKVEYLAIFHCNILSHISSREPGSACVSHLPPLTCSTLHSLQNSTLHLIAGQYISPYRHTLSILLDLVHRQQYTNVVCNDQPFVQVYQIFHQFHQGLLSPFFQGHPAITRSLHEATNLANDTVTHTPPLLDHQ